MTYFQHRRNLQYYNKIGNSPVFSTNLGRNLRASPMLSMSFLLCVTWLDSSLFCAQIAWIFPGVHFQVCKLLCKADQGAYCASPSSRKLLFESHIVKFAQEWARYSPNRNSGSPTGLHWGALCTHSHEVLATKAISNTSHTSIIG